MEPTYKDLIDVLHKRFINNVHRHRSVQWEDVEQALMKNEIALESLRFMEETGGEPDLIYDETKPGVYWYADCSKASPMGRRSLCYDQKALDQRKNNKPVGSAMELALSHGITILDEGQYRTLQSYEPFDEKTSSWIKTPEEIRSLGGALFCDRRYGQVFVYHNGADSYYSVRGFRGSIVL